jgi:ferrochelatase
MRPLLIRTAEPGTAAYNPPAALASMPRLSTFPSAARPGFMRYLSSSGFRHDVPSRCAVVLVALGTPRAPTAHDVRAYLREFLSDPRVVEIPTLAWWPILHGVILRVRPARSAAKYASIWTPEGSPLRIHSEQQALLLRGYLGERGDDVDVQIAMRYGEPSVATVIGALLERNVERLLVVPMYPQYSAATTASVSDAVGAALARVRNVPELRFVRHFHDDAGYIRALAARVTAHWQQYGRGERLLMSFHGVPRRTLLMGDPYHCECHTTARLLAERLGLAPQDYVVTFQSRFGRAEWLQPYTEPTLQALAKEGVRQVDVVCPGFVADCLETLEEIAQEARAAFIAAGGERFSYIACLNDAPAFINALADIAQANMQGWPTARAGAGAREQAAQRSFERARALGAAR